MKLSTRYHLTIGAIREYVRRIRNAQKLAKIAMSTPSYDNRQMTIKLLCHQGRNKGCAIADTAMDNFALDEKAVSIHVSFDVKNKTMTTVRKMR